jgi:hypothetical protein
MLLDQAVTTSSLAHISAVLVLPLVGTMRLRVPFPTRTPLLLALPLPRQSVLIVSFICGAMASQSTTVPSSATMTPRMREPWR